MYIPDIALLIGRIIAGGFFLMNGFNHFAKLNMMAGYAKSKGTFAPTLAVGGTGVILLLGGASLLLGYHPERLCWWFFCWAFRLAFTISGRFRNRKPR